MSISAAQYRAQTKAKRSEHSVQVEIMTFLDRVLPSSCMAFAVPNGGNRNAITGAIMKREGVKAGIADIVILRNPGNAALIEVKNSKGKLSDKQAAFADWCDANGFPFVVVRGLDDVKAFLTSAGIPMKGQAA